MLSEEHEPVLKGSMAENGVNIDNSSFVYEGKRFKEEEGEESEELSEEDKIRTVENAKKEKKKGARMDKNEWEQEVSLTQSPLASLTARYLLIKKSRK